MICKLDVKLYSVSLYLIFSFLNLFFFPIIMYNYFFFAFFISYFSLPSTRIHQKWGGSLAFSNFKSLWNTMYFNLMITLNPTPVSSESIWQCLPSPLFLLFLLNLFGSLAFQNYSDHNGICPWESPTWNSHPLPFWINSFCRVSSINAASYA